MIETLIPLLTALGGFEFIKWFANRKNNKRSQDASHIDWLYARLSDRDTKIDSLYQELRKEQEVSMKKTDEINRLNLELMEAAIKRCDIRGCGNRQPPSNY